MDNETWVVEEGDRIIQKKARLGVDRLTDWERLVYSLWVADYGMRNAGDLGTAREVFADFQSVALHSATKLSLPKTCSAFVLDPDTLQKRYFDLFESVCTEIRSAEPSVPLFADLSDADPGVVEAMNEARIHVARTYVVRPAVIAPTLLSAMAAIASFQYSWWALSALPFIWLGSICAAPNLNLANGCLAYLSILIGLVVTAFFRPLGMAVFAGAASGLYISAIEKWIRMRPAGKEFTDGSDNSGAREG